VENKFHKAICAEGMSENMIKSIRKYVTAPTTHEDSFVSQGLTPVAGVDEAGRGALVGPVVACAVVLPQGLVIEGVNDSKKIPPARRAELATRIKKEALAYAFGIVDVDVIEEINILQAALLAMRQAVESLTTKPQVVLVDGNKLPKLSCTAHAIKQGDSASHLIAAASILAKVERDAIMQKLHEEYPMYGFDKHKGYGTVLHKAMLKEHGLCPYHRKTFCE